MKTLIKLLYPISLVLAFIGGNLVTRKNSELLILGIIIIVISLGMLIASIIDFDKKLK